MRVALAVWGSLASLVLSMHGQRAPQVDAVEWVRQTFDMQTQASNRLTLSNVGDRISDVRVCLDTFTRQAGSLNLTHQIQMEAEPSSSVVIAAGVLNMTSAQIYTCLDGKTEYVSFNASCPYSHIQSCTLRNYCTGNLLESKGLPEHLRCSLLRCPTTAHELHVNVSSNDPKQEMLVYVKTHRIPWPARLFVKMPCPKDSCTIG
jgi:hypothetical protein